MRHRRHTFAIQHINVGTDVKLISKWLGHESRALTREYYGNWIKTMQIIAEDVSRDANAKMMAKVDAPRNQANSPARRTRALRDWLAGGQRDGLAWFAPRIREVPSAFGPNQALPRTLAEPPFRRGSRPAFARTVYNTKPTTKLKRGAG